MEILECKRVNLTQYKALFLVVTAVLSLLIASPALQRVLVYPRAEFFTELSLIGPGHLAQDYPYNITKNSNYAVFLDVSNQLGSCTYYQVEIKFRNETQSAPDNLNFTASSLPSLYNLTAFVADRESLEIPMSFAFNYSFQNVTRTFYTNVTVPGGPGQNSTFEQKAENITLLQTNFDNLKLNGATLNLQGYSSDLDPQKNVFFGNLIFELWIYNSTFGSFQYHERFVDLKFNMTATGAGDVFVG